MARRRQIRYDYTFDEQKALLGLDVKRPDEIIRSAEWRMAFHAESCPKMTGTVLRVTFTDPFPDAPPMRILFSIVDDDNVMAHWIEYLEPGMDDDIDLGDLGISDDDIPF
jgi:hypothetical protein